ncbi:MAG: gas vesicle protein [Deltaproteobacteria bacterium]|nr:gas vesicle protein [Deltaproteobacteria bacterium]
MDNREVSLCEVLDRILTKGAVIYGEVMLSVADVDLVYLGLQVILSSVETARGLQPGLGGLAGANLFEKSAQ